MGPILITNDYGVSSQGLIVLESIAKLIYEDVWVVAPEENLSGSGHSFTIDRPLRIRNIGNKKF